MRGADFTTADMAAFVDADDTACDKCNHPASHHDGTRAPYLCRWASTGCGCRGFDYTESIPVPIDHDEDNVPEQVVPLGFIEVHAHQRDDAWHRVLIREATVAVIAPDRSGDHTALSIAGAIGIPVLVRESQDTVARKILRAQELLRGNR